MLPSTNPRVAPARVALGSKGQLAASSRQLVQCAHLQALGRSPAIHPHFIRMLSSRRVTPPMSAKGTPTRSRSTLMTVDSRYSYSVVVAGNMNPSIHHPSWYRSCDLLSEGDEAFSLKSRKVLLLADFSTFTTPSLHVECTLERWSATAKPSTDRKVVLELAKGTFDHLSETPVTAFGLNLVATCELPAERASIIADRFRRGPFAPPLGDIEGVFEQLTMAYSLPRLNLSGDEWVDRTMRANAALTAKPSPAIQVSMNAHHQIRMTRASRFDFGPMLDAASTAFDLAVAHADLVIDQALGS
jgi:hypothetical protein